MFSKPKHGWTILQLENFTGYANYLTDIPIDILNCIVSYINTGQGLAILTKK